MNAATTPPAIRFAAPAPSNPEDDEDDSAASSNDKDPDSSHLHELCLQWAAWTASRRLYVRPSVPQSVIGKLAGGSSGTSRPSTSGPNAVAGAHLMAFHHAVLAQPPEGLDRQVFELHYLTRVRNIKHAASLLGISRQHWYTLLRDFRLRAHRASLEIMGSNLAAAAAMPSQVHAPYTSQNENTSEKVSSPQMTN